MDINPSLKKCFSFWLKGQMFSKNILLLLVKYKTPTQFFMVYEGEAFRTVIWIVNY